MLNSLQQTLFLGLTGLSSVTLSLILTQEAKALPRQVVCNVDSVLQVLNTPNTTSDKLELGTTAAKTMSMWQEKNWSSYLAKPTTNENDYIYIITQFQVRNQVSHPIVITLRGYKGLANSNGQTGYPDQGQIYNIASITVARLVNQQIPDCKRRGVSFKDFSARETKTFGSDGRQLSP